MENDCCKWNINESTSHKSSNKTVDSNENHEHTPRHCEEKRQASRKVSTSLLAQEVADFVREPFIQSGYRDADNITVRQCLATLFSMHNETVNIWSHIIAAAGFLLYFFKIFSDQDHIIGNPSIYPLICFAFGICLVFTSSALAHLFSCMSWRVRHTCFYADYATISIFSFTAGQAIFFYCRPLGKNASYIHNFPYLFLGISVSIASLNMFLSCLSRHHFRKYRFLIRTCMYLFKFLFDISPFLARCGFGSSTCSSTTIYLFNRHFLCYAISGITNACRIPERLCPGLFDYFGHSHHFLHFLTILGNYDAFTVVQTEMIERNVVLSATQYQPTFFSTFGLLILLVCVNTCIGVCFVNTWLDSEHQDWMLGSKYPVIYQKKNNYKNSFDGSLNNSRKKES